jgi:hypothetical protein
MGTKRIEWSYPTSPNAVKFKFSKVGCWTVELIEGTNPPWVMEGFDTYEKAKAYANTIPEPWDRLTR